MTTELLKKHLFTVDDYHRMAEAGVLSPEARVELIEGEVVEMSPIGREHVARVTRISHVFWKRFGGKAVVYVQNPLGLGRHSEPEPDVALLRPRTDYYESALPTAGDVLLVVEVADTTANTDRTVKVPLYARAGIPEAWVMDIRAGVIEVHRQPCADGYTSVSRTGREGVLTVEAFPGESIPAGELLG